MKFIKKTPLFLACLLLSALGELLPTTGSLLKYLQPSTALYTIATVIGLAQYFLINNLIHIVQLKLALSDKLNEERRTKKIKLTNYFLFGFIYLIEAISIGLILQNEQDASTLSNSLLLSILFASTVFYIATPFKIQTLLNDFSVKDFFKKYSHASISLGVSVLGLIALYFGNTVYSSHSVRSNTLNSVISREIHEKLGNTTKFIIAISLVSLVPFLEVLIYKAFTKATSNQKT